MKTIIIDGNDFNSYEGFTRAIAKQIGIDEELFGLDWLDDILYGGVAYFDEDEHIEFVWKNASKSKRDLNNDTSKILDENMRKVYGNLYELIIRLIGSHPNVHLRLE